MHSIKQPYPTICKRNLIYFVLLPTSAKIKLIQAQHLVAKYACHKSLKKPEIKTFIQHFATNSKLR